MSLPNNIRTDSRDDEQIVTESLTTIMTTGQTLYIDGLPLSAVRELFEERLTKGMYHFQVRPLVEQWAEEHSEHVTLMQAPTREY